MANFNLRYYKQGLIIPVVGLATLAKTINFSIKNLKLLTKVP